MKKIVGKKSVNVKPVQSAYDDEAKWDNRELGNDLKHLVSASKEAEAKIEDSLGLQMVSMRLQKELIEELKFIAKYRGVGYQPIVRDVLQRFARSEILTIMHEVQQTKAAKKAIKENRDCA